MVRHMMDGRIGAAMETGLISPVDPKEIEMTLASAWEPQWRPG